MNMGEKETIKDEFIKVVKEIYENATNCEQFCSSLLVTTDLPIYKDLVCKDEHCSNLVELSRSYLCSDDSKENLNDSLDDMVLGL